MDRKLNNQKLMMKSVEKERKKKGKMDGWMKILWIMTISLIDWQLLWHESQYMYFAIGKVIINVKMQKDRKKVGL